MRVRISRNLLFLVVFAAQAGLASAAEPLRDLQAVAGACEMAAPRSAAFASLSPSAQKIREMLDLREKAAEGLLMESNLRDFLAWKISELQRNESIAEFITLERSRDPENNQISEAGRQELQGLAGLRIASADFIAKVFNGRSENNENHIHPVLKLENLSSRIETLLGLLNLYRGNKHPRGLTKAAEQRFFNIIFHGFDLPQILKDAAFKIDPDVLESRDITTRVYQTNEAEFIRRMLAIQYATIIEFLRKIEKAVELEQSRQASTELSRPLANSAR